MESQKSCSHTGFWIVIVCLCGLLLMSVAINSGVLVGWLIKRASAETTDYAVDEFPDLAEVWSYGSGKVKVARILLSGVITRQVEDGLFIPKYDRVEYLLRQIRTAQNDEEVRAIVLEVDSPGGEITPSDEIYEALMDFKDSATNRTVIAVFKDVAASGAYYAAMASDWIIAEPTSLIGSIGVIMQGLNWKGLSDKIGVRDTTIISGTNKDLLNPFRDPRPEEIALLQGIVDADFQRFFDIVQAGRQIDADTLRPLADGSVFSPQAALDHNLIDEIGYWDEVMDRTLELLGEKTVKFIRYEEPVDFFTWITQARLPIRLSSLFEERPKLMYLWKP